MAEGQELLRIGACRIWRRRWLALGVSWAVCALGWTAVLTAQLTAAAAGLLLLGLVLLAGAAAGGLVAALAATREPVFDSSAELRRAFAQPVLGQVADLTPRSRRRAGSDLLFGLACLALIAVLAGLLLAQAAG